MNNAVSSLIAICKLALLWTNQAERNVVGKWLVYDVMTLGNISDLREDREQYRFKRLFLRHAQNGDHRAEQTVSDLKLMAGPGKAQRTLRT